MYKVTMCCRDLKGAELTSSFLALAKNMTSDIQTTQRIPHVLLMNQWDQDTIQKIPDMYPPCPTRECAHTFYMFT